MNVIIIEDEQYTAEDLEKNIRKYLPEATIQAILMSVKEATDYLKRNPHPDLFFSDIQLGDGLSFEIFKVIQTAAPVIFITAFDEYALKAFKANGIDYILKPFDSGTISEAVNKFKTFTAPKKEDNNMEKLLNYMEANQSKKSTILVYQKDKIIPLHTSGIALFYSESESVKVLCDDGRSFMTNATLDELSKSLGNDFYRANRQFIVNRKTIKDASHYFGRKLTLNLTIHFSEKIIISKEKASSFLSWLSM